LAEISLDWISDLRLRLFPLEIECDYDKTLAGLLKGDHMTGHVSVVALLLNADGLVAPSSS
jgi:hypothetical protein